jgi:DNA helicase II / ATP-dependent DNA helicase PcrA
MESKNKAILATAGSGKTTKAVERALSIKDGKVLVSTYTLEAVSEIHRKMVRKNGSIPRCVSIMSWLSFLLQECARPYSAAIVEDPIDGILFLNQESAPRIPEKNTKAHYFGGKYIYQDKISKFTLKCNSVTSGKVVRRLERCFTHIFIDEFQDLAGYDIELLEELLKSRINILIVGDARQATYKTNNSRKNKGESGVNILKRIEDWQRSGLIEVEYDYTSYRCHQKICDIADKISPTKNKMVSKNTIATNHDGVFYTEVKYLSEYLRTYNPIVLRYDKKTDFEEGLAQNFGMVKGKEFPRVLILSNGPLNKFLIGVPLGSPQKYYVALTRAIHSVCIVTDAKVKLDGVEFWIPS